MKMHPITRKFIDEITHKPTREIEYMGLKLEIQPNVFPVDSPFSLSPLATAENIPSGARKVLDVGTGTGVQALIAARYGAKKVLAVDIDERAVNNARINVEKNDCLDRIRVQQSDLFSTVPREKYDLIIGQLPFADVKWEGDISHLLFDNNYELHERFLSQAKDYLEPQGSILIPSGEVADESKLQELITNYNFRIREVKAFTKFNIEWKTYVLANPFD